MTGKLKEPERRHLMMGLLGAAGAIAGAAGLASRINAAGLTGESLIPLQGRREFLRANHLPNVPLVNQDGRLVNFYDDLVWDRIVVINFFYSLCSNTCPVSTSNLMAARDDLARRGHGHVEFLSVSLAPEFDTPEVLKAYAERFGTSPGWNFLTGRREDVDKLRRSLGVYDLDSTLDQDPARHTGLAVIGNEPLSRWRAMPSLARPVRIRQAIERVLLPASAWPDGRATVMEAPYDDSMAVDDPVDPLVIAQLQDLISQR